MPSHYIFCVTTQIAFQIVLTLARCWRVNVVTTVGYMETMLGRFGMQSGKIVIYFTWPTVSSTWRTIFSSLFFCQKKSSLYDNTIKYKWYYYLKQNMEKIDYFIAKEPYDKSSFYLFFFKCCRNKKIVKFTFTVFILKSKNSYAFDTWFPKLKCLAIKKQGRWKW